MTSTYEVIKALPGKGFDWQGFANAIGKIYEADQSARNHDAGYLAELSEARGVRQLREVSYRMAASVSFNATLRSSFIPPSPETLSWRGFLGGTSCVWHEEDAAEPVIQVVAGLAKQFRR